MKKRINKLRKHKYNRGFTLVELITVIAVIAVLVLLAAPQFIGRTKEADKTKHIGNANTLEDASERYFVDHQDWPRLTDDAYTSEEVERYSERVLDITGEEVHLDPDGNYYDIDYEALSKYVKIPNDSDKNNYILRNPIGKIYYLEGVDGVKKSELIENIKTGKGINSLPYDEWVDYLVENEGYYLGTDKDFEKHYSNGKNHWRYTGDKEYIIIPLRIKEELITSYFNMFLYNDIVRGVASNSPHVQSMEHMFWYSSSSELDLRFLNTYSVTNMRNMFGKANAISLDLRSFDTSNVTNMSQMFWGSKANNIDVTSFNTAEVDNMRNMFNGTTIKTINLRTFDTALANASFTFSNDGKNRYEGMDSMFKASNITTIYAKNKENAENYLKSEEIPSNVNIVF